MKKSEKQPEELVEDIIRSTAFRAAKKDMQALLEKSQPDFLKKHIPIEQALRYFLDALDTTEENAKKYLTKEWEKMS